MAVLRRVDGPRIIGRRLAGGRPVLGICVGMQVLFDVGVEWGERTEGCGQWPGTVERLKADVLPHMGWNTVRAPAGTTLFAGMPADTRFYFVHSFAVRRWEMEESDALRPPPSATPRSPATRAPRCCATGCATSSASGR